MHIIDEKSPLFDMTPEIMAAREVEFLASVVGTDDTSLQRCTVVTVTSTPTWRGARGTRTS